MKTLALSALCVLALRVITPVAAAEGLPPPRESAHSRATRLVPLLGAARFRDREAAVQELLELGADAMPAVLLGRASDDAAVAERCDQLYPTLRVVAARRLVERAQAGGSLDGLPLADTFVAACGPGAEARAYYLLILDKHFDLLERVEAASAPQTNEIYLAHIADMQQRMQPNRFGRFPGGMPQVLSPIEVATMLLIGASQKGVESKNQPHDMLANFLYQPPILEALRDPKTGLLMQDLLFTHLELREDAGMHQTVLNMMINGQLTTAGERGFRFALKMAKEKMVQVHVRMPAVIYLCQALPAERLGDIEALLNDKTILRGPPNVGNDVMLPTEVRDIVLAHLVLRTKQPFKEYGFPALTRNPVVVQNFMHCSFSDAEQRKAALAKWPSGGRPIPT